MHKSSGARLSLSCKVKCRPLALDSDDCTVTNTSSLRLSTGPPTCSSTVLVSSSTTATGSDSTEYNMMTRRGKTHAWPESAAPPRPGPGSESGWRTLSHWLCQWRQRQRSGLGAAADSDSLRVSESPLTRTWSGQFNLSYTVQVLWCGRRLVWTRHGCRQASFSLSCQWASLTRRAGVQPRSASARSSSGWCSHQKSIITSSWRVVPPASSNVGRKRSPP